MRKAKMDWVCIVSTVVMTLFAIVVCFPFWVCLVTSVISNASYARNAVQLIPESFTLDNYRYILRNSQILVGYKNTLMVVGIGLLYCLCVSLTMAYGLSCKDYPGKRFFIWYLLIPMYLSGGLIPVYLLLRNLHLIDSLWSIILLCGLSPFNIILLKNGIEQLPMDLIEAARIDRAGELTIFVRVVVPLIKPILVTVLLFTAVSYWNEWFWSMITLNSSAKRTLQVILRGIVSQGEGMDSMSSTLSYANVFQEGIKMAAVVATMLPIMLVYPFLQKHFAKGIMIGAVKM